MPLREYHNQAEKYEYISNQHGGYYRHDFIDHAYLYNLYFPPEEVFERFKNKIHDLVLNYPVAQDALASLMGRIINQKAEHLVIGNGAAELIKIVSGQLAQTLIIPVPSFNEYANAAPKGHVIECPLEFPSFELDVEKFADHAIKVKADVAVVVSPNNPTSRAIPKFDLVFLAKKLGRHNCRLFIDESFIDFAQDSHLLTMEPEIERYPNIAVLKSMSKAYGICGLRIGYLLTANTELAHEVRQGVHIWNINGFAEEFLRLLPDFSDDFIKSCNRVKQDRGKLYKDLKSLLGGTIYAPDANFIFYRLPDGGPDGPEVTKRLFIEHNMYIKHCGGKTMPEADRFIRIAARTNKENSNLVDALVSILGYKKL